MANTSGDKKSSHVHYNPDWKTNHIRLEVSEKVAAYVLASYPEARDGHLVEFMSNNPHIWKEFWTSDIGVELEERLENKYGKSWREGFIVEQMPIRADGELVHIQRENETVH